MPRVATEKLVADQSVLNDLIHYLFVCDEHEFRDDRFRVQLAFAMLVQAYIGCRPGSIVETGTRWSTNDGLFYQDVTLQAERTNDDLHFVMTVYLRHRKSQPNLTYRLLCHVLVFDADICYLACDMSSMSCLHTVGYVRCRISSHLHLPTVFLMMAS